MGTLFDQEQDGGACRADAAPGFAGVPSSASLQTPSGPSNPLRGRWVPLTTIEQAYQGRRVRAYQGPNKGRTGTVEGHTPQGTVQISWDDPSTTATT